MVSCLGHEAWITDDDGTEFPEYPKSKKLNISGDTPATVTCWISSEIGKNFVVNHSSPTDEDYRVRLWIDGHLYCEQISPKSPKSNSQAFSIEGIPESDDSIRLFTFAAVDTTDDDAMLDKPVDPSLGCIWVQIDHVIIKDKFKSKSRTSFSRIPPQRKVHEKNKPAMDHRVRFQDRKAISAKKGPEFAFEYDGEKPVVKFIFNYKPLEVLQRQGLARKPPPAAPEAPAVRTAPAPAVHAAPAPVPAQALAPAPIPKYSASPLRVHWTPPPAIPASVSAPEAPPPTALAPIRPLSPAPAASPAPAQNLAPPVAPTVASVTQEATEPTDTIPEVDPPAQEDKPMPVAPRTNPDSSDIDSEPDGDSEHNNEKEIKSLRKHVKKLEKREIKWLKKRIADLEGSASSSGSSRPVKRVKKTHESTSVKQEFREIYVVSD